MEVLFCHESISVLLKNGSEQCEKRFNVMRTTLAQIRLCIHIILSEPLFAVWILPIHFFKTSQGYVVKLVKACFFFIFQLLTMFTDPIK